MNKEPMDQIDKMILNLDTSMPKNLEKKLLLVPSLSTGPENLYLFWKLIRILFFIITLVIMVADNFGIIAEQIYVATETLLSFATPEIYLKIAGGFAGGALVGVSWVLYQEFSEDFFVPAG